MLFIWQINCILLSSFIVFTSKNIIFDEEGKEISVIKSFSHLYEYFPELGRSMFKDRTSIKYTLKRIVLRLKRFGEKSRKTGKKTFLDILKSIKL